MRSVRALGVVVHSAGDGPFERLEKDEHALDGIIAAFAFLASLPEPERSATRRDVARLITEWWNHPNLNARRFFSLLDPSLGQAHMGMERWIAARRRGGVKSATERKRAAKDWRSEGQKVMDEEALNRKMQGREPITRKDLPHLLRHDPRTKGLLFRTQGDVLVPLSDETIMKAFKVRRPKGPRTRTTSVS